MVQDLFLIWFFGMIVAFMINLFGDIRPVSRATFNVIFWPVALTIVCFKGFLTHIIPEKKKNARKA